MPRNTQLVRLASNGNPQPEAVVVQKPGAKIVDLHGNMGETQNRKVSILRAFCALSEP